MNIISDDYDTDSSIHVKDINDLNEVSRSTTNGQETVIEKEELTDSCMDKEISNSKEVSIQHINIHPDVNKVTESGISSMDDEITNNKDLFKETEGCSSVRELLDCLETRIEELRGTVVKLAREKEELLSSLQWVKGDTDLLEQLGEVEGEEVKLEVDRLVGRVMGVKVDIVTARGAGQVEALQMVEEEVNVLIGLVEGEDSQAEKVCRSYLSACGGEEGGRDMNQKFERILLGCAVEDQKKIKAKLKGILEQILIIAES